MTPKNTPPSRMHIQNNLFFLSPRKKMEINAVFDVESSKLSGKTIFSCEYVELTQEDIAEFKKKKLIQYVNEDDLLRMIPCQVLVFLENINKAKVIFFNPRFVLAQEVFDHEFLNRNLIERCQTNGGFRLEFTIPLYDKSIKLDFSLKI